MRGARKVLGPFPPLLAGLAAAIALETSIGLLLYADEGLLPALTLILTVEFGALGLGLWTGRVNLSGGVVEQIRRRWLFCLVAFALAAAFSAGLDFSGQPTVTGFGQGAGLAFLGGLPLFSIGALLGAMNRRDESGRPYLPSAAAPSVLGGALGFLLAGTVLIPHAAPYTLYLFSLVMLSGGALFQGWVLDDRPVVQVLEARSGPGGEVRVEGRALGSPRREVKVLLEEGRLRGVEGRDGEPGLGWETALGRGFAMGAWHPDSCLFLGGGTGTLPRLFHQNHPLAEMRIEDRSGELVSLARAHFAEWNGWKAATLAIREPLTGPMGGGGSYALVVVDCSALPRLGRVPYLRDSDWVRLARTVKDGGALVLGGIYRPSGSSNVALAELAKRGSAHFPQAYLLLSETRDLTIELLPEVDGEEEAVLLFSTDGGPDPGSVVPGFTPHPGQALRGPEDD